MERYLLQKSQERPNGWVLTDTKYGIVCHFEGHRFNETQEICVLEDNALAGFAPTQIARLVREMTDWAAANHYSILMPTPAFPYSERLRIGQELKARREVLELSVEKLADIVGVQPKTISNIEQGRFNVQIDLLSKIARSLGSEVRIEKI